jgi:hypothetical protein
LKNHIFALIGLSIAIFRLPGPFEFDRPRQDNYNEPRSGKPSPIGYGKSLDPHGLISP